MDWKPDADYERVAEANRLFYQRVARIYDQTETCVSDPLFQKKLQDTLTELLALIPKPPSEIAALDACGGTGNVALKLAARGIPVTLADISPSQLEIYREKCEGAGLTSKIHCGDVAQFLRESRVRYDLIVFSSALHHLADYRSVLGLAFRALAPGGLILTLYDPTLVARRKRLSQFVLSMDYLLFKVREQWKDVPAGVARRIKRKVRGAGRKKAEAALTDENIGFMAEYHINTGIDDLELVRNLKESGAEVLWHRRLSGGRHGFTRKLVGWLGDATDFSLLIQKPR